MIIMGNKYTTQDMIDFVVWVQDKFMYSPDHDLWMPAFEDDGVVKPHKTEEVFAKFESER